MASDTITMTAEAMETQLPQYTGQIMTVQITTDKGYANVYPDSIGLSNGYEDLRQLGRRAQEILHGGPIDRSFAAHETGWKGEEQAGKVVAVLFEGARTRARINDAHKKYWTEKEWYWHFFGRTPEGQAVTFECTPYGVSTAHAVAPEDTEQIEWCGPIW